MVNFVLILSKLWLGCIEKLESTAARKIFRDGRVNFYCNKSKTDGDIGVDTAIPRLSNYHELKSTTKFSPILIGLNQSRDVGNYKNIWMRFLWYPE